MGMPCGVRNSDHFWQDSGGWTARESPPERGRHPYLQTYRQKDFLEFSPQGALPSATRLSIRHLEGNVFLETIESDQFRKCLNYLIRLTNGIRRRNPSLPLDCLAASQVSEAAHVFEDARQVYRQRGRQNTSLGTDRPRLMLKAHGQERIANQGHPDGDAT